MMQGFEWLALMSKLTFMSFIYYILVTYFQPWSLRALIIQVQPVTQS
jgi:hypothetical protein